MKIEWNRVTWYSKLIAVILFVGTFCLAFSLGKEYGVLEQNNNGNYQNPVTSIDSSTGKITLGIGKTGKIGGIKIIINSLIQDSRCPTDVTCIWAGEASFNVTLDDGLNKYSGKITLGNNAVKLGNKNVSLTSVNPAPHSKKQISLQDYRIEVSVD